MCRSLLQKVCQNQVLQSLLVNWRHLLSLLEQPATRLVVCCIPGVQVSGLVSASQHNGKIGEVVNFDALTARYHVKVAPGGTGMILLSQSV